MSEPVSMTVALHGDDIEIQAMNACVFVLESQFSRRPGFELRFLTPEQRARVAAYLAARYATPVTP